MNLEYSGRYYEILLASDVIRDGMALEVLDTAGARTMVLEAFWSDKDASFTFAAYTDVLPFEVVEFFMTEARRRLPPDDAGDSPSQIVIEQ